ncbi:MAG: amidohydrolase [Bacteroidales bacterium]|nr:amidohydrolase [Bacteroidales bacterium]
MEYEKIRHHLHRIAEPSNHEDRTRAYILEVLKSLHPTRIHTFPESRHLVAEYDFGAGPVTLLRGDFDAVRVEETLDLPYRADTPGVSHKCGHDGHTTILLGVAERLMRQPLPRGKVLLFFQAAEETGEGAAQLLASGFLDQHRPDKVFALHNIPGIPLGSVICRPGSFTCSVVSCDIELHGRTSHAAEPLKALSPYPAAKELTDRILALCQHDMLRDDYRIATLIEFRVGEPAYGVTAGHGVLRFTIRAKDDALLQATKASIEQMAAEVAQREGLRQEVSWREYFAASNNHPEMVARLMSACKTLGYPYQTKESPFSWGEDFGLLTQHFPGALFGLGSGEQQPPLHHPDFDFPDALIPLGVDLFCQLLNEEE